MPVARRRGPLTPEQAAALAAQTKPPQLPYRVARKPRLYPTGLTRDIVDAISKSVVPKPPTMKPTRRAVPPSQTRHLEPIQVPITAPWDGFTPDLSHRLTPFGGVNLMSGLVVVGENVTTDDGWERLQQGGGGALRLGHDTDTSDYTNPGGTWGRGRIDVGPADTVDQPIFVIGESKDGSAAGAPMGVAVTAANATAFPFRQYAHLFTCIAGTWANRPYDSWRGFETIAGTPDASTTNPPFNGGSVYAAKGPDWAYWPYPIPGERYAVNGMIRSTGVSNGTRPSFFWCNLNDEVMRYPDSSTTSNFTDFWSYGIMLFDAVAAVGGTNADIQSLRCASLEMYQDRMLYFNLQETSGIPAAIGGAVQTIARPQRIRWSVIGNPLIVSPGLQVLGYNGVGSGWIDLTGFQGQGLRIESLGDVVACYLEDGVSFLRRTGDPEAAFIREDVTSERGLLATQSLVNLGGGVHFGLFTDGWYFFDSAGRWREAGTHDENGKLSYKWKDRFYQSLQTFVTGTPYINAIRCSYDPFRKFVRISIPTTFSLTLDSPNTDVWIYDVQGDRVFRDTYAGIGGLDRFPSAMGDFYRDNATPVPSTAFYKYQCHGDNNGMLYLRKPETLRREGVKPPWTLETHDFAVPDPFSVKRLDKVWVQYNQDGTEVDPTPQMTVISEIATSAATNVDFSQAGGTSVHSAPASFNIPGRSHRVRLTGVGKPKILGLRAQVVGTEGRLGVESPAES